MRHRLDALAELAVPAGYQLRTLQPDDRDAWASLLNETGELGRWDSQRATRYFAPGSAVALEHSFFVLDDGKPVATAQLELHTSDRYAPLAELGWVAVSPAHQGRGLGFVVCLAVLRGARSARQPGVFLRTDDHRLAAIATYLKLGFEPWLRDGTAKRRWRHAHAALQRRTR